MSERKILIAGNWKMNGDSSYIPVISEIAQRAEGVSSDNIESLICMPFTFLAQAQDEARGRNLQIGAQNCHWEEKGAYTGEISPKMLQDLGVNYVILGHSERIIYCHEDNQVIANKVSAATRCGLKPILCIGETLEQREQGVTKEELTKQLKARLSGEVDFNTLVVAYEPIWAIGTGKIPSLADISEASTVIRACVRELSGGSDNFRLLYGGSVDTSNIDDILSVEGIDGALIGGASLVPDKFISILEICAE